MRWHVTGTSLKNRFTEQNGVQKQTQIYSYTAYDNGNSAMYLGKGSLSSINGAGLIWYPYGKSIPDEWLMKIQKIKQN